MANAINLEGLDGNPNIKSQLPKNLMVNHGKNFTKVATSICWKFSHEMSKKWECCNTIECTVFYYIIL